MQRNWFRIVLALGALLMPLPAIAQTDTPAEPQVRELSGDEVTSESLIEVLQPREEAPPEFRARGRAPVRPDCAFYRKQRGGGAGKAAAAIASIRILFAYDSAVLTPEATRNLDELGKALTSKALSPCCFRIEGHTDSEGTEDYNRSLSARRAHSVIDYLARHFEIDRDRLLAVGLGESKPITGNNTDEGRSRNRRVQVVNLGYGEVEP